MAGKAKFQIDQDSAFKSIIGRGSENQEEPAPEAKVVGRGRPKEERETKQRISLAVLPSLYENIKKISYVERKSVSEIVSECMEQYVTENAAKLKEYNKIKKD